MSVGSLTSTDSHGPFTKYLDVYGIKLLVLPEVTIEFPGKVAQISIYIDLYRHEVLPRSRKNQGRAKRGRRF